MDYRGHEVIRLDLKQNPRRGFSAEEGHEGYAVSRLTLGWIGKAIGKDM